jgi:hypothetical protein
MESVSTHRKPNTGNFRIASIDFDGTWSWVDVATKDHARRTVRAMRNGCEKVFVFNKAGDCVYRA